MIYTTALTVEPGVVVLRVDLSDDAGLEPGSIVVTTRVRGDAAFYAGIAAADFKRNHPDLFPLPEDDGVGVGGGADEIL